VTTPRLVCQIGRVKSGIRRGLWACAVVIVLAGVAWRFWVRQFHEYTPVEALRDLQAAARVGPSARPVERFLQLRYGPMSNPANRQKAFLDFFNIGHIKGLNILVSRTAPGQRQANIDAMGQWVANYRSRLTPEDKAALGAYLRSDAGHATLRQAAEQYLREDVHFRARTAGVVQELLTTVATVRNP
jgi:hypothetical protein